MKYIGAHVSTQGGVFNAPLHALELGAKAFAFFTKNQRRWFSEPYTTADILKFKENLKKSGILAEHILAHAGYLINLGHPDENSRNQSLNSFIDEINRCEQLGVKKLVFHPGSHLRQVSEKDCMNYIATSINKALLATKNVMVLLENMAGQGSNLGYKLEQLAYIISKITDQTRIGVCIDTCHLFASGYDFTCKEKYTKIWQQFDEIVGFKYFQGMHLNDSKCELESLKDRHESLGKGLIGLEPFKLLMQDHRFDNLPFVLETVDPTIWPDEIKLLYSYL